MEQRTGSIFRLLFVLMAVACSLLVTAGVFNFVSAFSEYKAPTNYIPASNSIDALANSTLTERPVSYHSLTVLDKNAEERSLLSDTYNVIFATEDGEIIKLNNMTVYYSVEKGHTYNASFTYGFQDIVGEVN